MLVVLSLIKNRSLHPPYYPMMLHSVLLSSIIDWRMQRMHFEVPTCRTNVAMYAHAYKVRLMSMVAR